MFQFLLNAAKLWHLKPTRIGVEPSARTDVLKAN